uniref:Cytoskeleton associated protein 2-like n=1 Tax=Nannospalax galili TaxID=1026970 RepID=A0A8C6RUD7_NANGA
MVGLGPAAAAAAAARKLQEYLAAKGKLKDRNTKPYLKAKSNHSNPPSSKSTVRPRKDVSNHAVLPVKTRPINTKLQPKPASIMGPQKPKLEPPKFPGKRLTSRCISSNSNCKQSSKSQQQREAGSPTAGQSRKPMQSTRTLELKTKQPQEADEGHAKCTDSMVNTLVENKPLDDFLKEMNKENFPQTLLDPEKNPDPGLCVISKPKTNCCNQTKNGLAPKQVLGKSLVNNTVLKDRVNQQFVRKTQIRTQPVKLQQLSRVADSAKPRENIPRPALSHFIQTQNRAQASKKPVLKNTQDIKVNRGKYGKSNETKGQSYPATEQKIKHAKPSTYPHLLQRGHNDRHPNIKQDQKTIQQCLGPRTSYVPQKSRVINQRPNLTASSFNSVVPSTPSIRANRTHNNKYKDILQQKAQTVDYKFKKALPGNHFLSKTASKTRSGFSTVNETRAPSATQPHPNVEKKTAAEDRRKQLEEWQKSKGKTYKRPPMEFKTKRKIIEEMNISFWKSIEKEEEEKKAQLELSNKINSTLTECLRLIEEGVLSNEIFTILSSIPEAEKFAKFWVCKAKLLARKGTFDVIGLYEEAIKNGATPIQDLREVVLSILQDPSRNTEDSLAAEANITSMEELAKKEESGQSCLSPKEREQITATPQITMAELGNCGIKLQIAPIPRICGMPEVQDMKLITPVRRSTRIERAVSRYPGMLQDHDVVVASLDELLEVEDTECFVFRKNEALPVTLGFQILES